MYKNEVCTRTRYVQERGMYKNRTRYTRTRYVQEQNEVYKNEVCTIPLVGCADQATYNNVGSCSFPIITKEIILKISFAELSLCP
jgi:hypothetical protein